MELTPKVEFLGFTIDLAVVISSLLAAVIVFVLVYMVSRGRQMVPKGMQTLIEMMVDFSRSITQIGFTDVRTADKFVGFTFTLFLYLLVANQLGVVLMVTSHDPVPALGITAELMHKLNSHGVSWLKSPTADINVTIAMAFSVALYANFIAIRRNFKGYLKSFINPLHIIETISNPITHAMRLWANIFAGEVLITIMLSKGTIWLNGTPLIVWMAFSLFVGVIQAYVFTILTNVYIGQKFNSEQH